jgi:hypothetical protein
VRHPSPGLLSMGHVCLQLCLLHVVLQGLSVIVVEGRERIGGRLHTIQGDIGEPVTGWVV